MAQIEHVQISGLAGRDGSVSFELHSDLNVFWGANGSGKTSVLKILHAALTGDADSIVRVPFDSARVRFHGTPHGDTVTRSIKKAQQQLDEESAESEESPWLDVIDRGMIVRQEVARASRARWQTKPVTDGRRRYAHGYLPISRMSDLSSVSSTTARRLTYGGSPAALNEAELDAEFARQTMALWKEYVNQSLQKIRRAQQQGIAEILSAVLMGERSRKVAQDIGTDHAFELVTSFLRSQHISASQLTSRQRFAANYETNHVLQSVIGRIAEIDESVQRAQEPQQKLTDLLSAMFSGGKHVTFDTRTLAVRGGGEETIPIESLSSGEKQMIRILLECLAADDDCILIDEPELSLHVDWQHRLVECMRLVNPNVQIILATHSPEVMAEIPLAKTFEL